ncbi:MAG: BREX protein BrxB domain-containing protein [Planctomycetota bacterium]|nr:BREX protein BrxB domain-containing protein [Planctomycetota bacterium]MEC8508761.1 BREX protein BrxB domain-containing protein [Planctomycetota bacterium]
MPSNELERNFNEVIERVGRGRSFDHTSSEPVFYLVFKPNEIIEVKQKLTAWKSRLKQHGYEVHVFSVAHAIQQILEQAPLRRFWLKGDAESPLEWRSTNESLSTAVQSGLLREQLRSMLDDAAANDKSVVLVTDLEALHPYMRIGQIESQLQGCFHVPTIIFYPGTRTGETRLKFLGFYPEDGNYRSLHIGG